MHQPAALVGEWLRKAVIGYYQYHAVPGNLDRLCTFRHRLRRLWRAILFRRSLRIASLHIEEVLAAPRSPWQNPYAERLICSIRRDCLHHFVILNARHLKRTLASYFAY
jgi:hypothetical protein